MTDKPHAIIIGAGFTGCATAHDLALRGFKVTVVERGDIASGTSGRTHGLLHSGGRYCVTDQEAGIECIEENILLRKIAKQCIEFNGGLFVALDENDLAFAPRFTAGAQACHIPIEEIKPQEIKRIEPNLNPKVLLAYTVPDGSFDPLRLALVFAATAKKNGAQFHVYHQVNSLIIDGQRNVSGVKVLNRTTGKDLEIKGDIVINATGAWAGEIAAMAQATVPIKPTPGVMVAYDQRVTERVINRLIEPSDGDIIIPQRRMAVIGTTSFEVKDVDYIPVLAEQIQQMNAAAYELVPTLRQARMRGAYMSARPLIGSSIQGRSLSRTFKCYDHQESNSLGGFVTITGGKATTCRGMAEKTADLVCHKLGISAQCQTRDVVLRPYREYYHDQEDAA
jgi:glycerol-3-phosphate dehydrogenase